MPSYVQTAFIGGEISQSAQGRMDLPAYKISMNACFNGIPVESGAWQRRPGTQHVAPMAGGNTGRAISFAFEDASPYMMIVSDGIMRFTTGPSLVMTNDQQAVSAISAANPAVVQTAAVHGWSTGNSVAFNALGINNPTLQNRQFLITVVDTTHFSLTDAITGATIDGSTLGAFVSGNVARILEIATTWSSGTWSSLRSVQAETRSVLLNGTAPQVLQVATPPTSTQFATFTFGPANFIDGPYLDPIPDSVVTSSALNGVVTLTFTYQAYVAAQAYNIGDFVTSGGACYQSLTPLNQGNTPASSPTNWAVVNGGTAINNGQGFIGSDIGRLIRLFSEPVAWAVGTSYSTGNTVSYPDGQGGNSYWTATGTIAAGVQPGTSTSWALNATGAQWTWAQIVSVSGAGLIAPQTAIGTMTGGGGIAAAFNGNTSQNFASGANKSFNITTWPVWSATTWVAGSAVQYGGFEYFNSTFTIIPVSSFAPWSGSTAYPVNSNVTYNGFQYAALQANQGVVPTNTNSWVLVCAISTSPPSSAPSLWSRVAAMPQPTEDVYIGQHYSSGQTVQYATLFPSSDIGLANAPGANATVNLRASNSSPTSPSNGTLLGTATVPHASTAAVTITSSDAVSTWTYVWFEIAVKFIQPLSDNGSHVFTGKMGVSEAQFFNASSTNGSVIMAQISGLPLLYNLPINTWQLGVYSNTTGWPTCGCYYQGRIWLGGVVSNRFDACVSNGLSGTDIDFTPTSPNGTVSDNNSISYICDATNSNELLWMKEDQQGVLFATQEGPWLISAPSPGAMTPTNIQAVRINGPGTANIEPRRTEHTLVYVHKFARKIMEYFADVFSGKFSAPNLSERAKHLTVNGIAEIAYQQELAPTIWARRNDGALIGAIYKRDTLTTSQGPNIIGWHRHQLGSGRLVESIAVGPSVNGDLENLTLITNDPSTGIRHIELMTDLLDEGFALTDCWYVDNGIVPSSTLVQAPTPNAPFGSLVLFGLWQHNGKTCSAFVAGLDCGDFAVVNGAMTIPFGDGVSGGTAQGLFTAALVNSFATLPAAVGFTYTSQGQLVRPVTQADTGTHAGPGWAKLGRNHRFAAFLYGCVNGSISFGTDFGTTMFPAKLRQLDGRTGYPVNQLWSGIVRDNIANPYDFDGMITWQISRPLPAFVIALGGFDEKADA